MDPPPAPKRSKAAAARSLLHRVSSRTEVPTLADQSAKQETSSPIAPSPLSTSMAPPANVATTPTTPTSIDSSVRMFRLFEALRRGDTATISKALKDSSTTTSVNNARTSTSSLGSSGALALEGTTVLHLAIQCADLSIIEFILASTAGAADVNAQDKDGNTPLHLAATLNRNPVIRLLLQQNGINETLTNYQGRTALDLASSPEVFQQLQLARSLYIDAQVKQVQKMVASQNYEGLEQILTDSHFQRTVDVNGPQLATDLSTAETGGTLLHEAAYKRDSRLIEILLLNGADPFQRDRKSRLPQDVTKDEKIRFLLRKSPAAAAAQRGVQEKSILGSGGMPVVAGPASSENALGGKEGREMRGYLKKWVNYTTGYKLRWFVLEEGVLSYYKHQDDAGSACRGAINMRIAQLHMDAQDKTRFELLGKASVKYHLKANHQVEAKRWVWALNNAIQYCKDEAKALAKSQTRSAELLRQAKMAELERKNTREVETGFGVGLGRSSTHMSRDGHNDEDGTGSLYNMSEAGDDVGEIVRKHRTTAISGDTDDEDDFNDDASSVEMQPESKDAFLISAHSARLQLDLLSQISSALQAEQTRNPNTTISQPTVAQALSSYDAAIANLNNLVGDLGRIARDREAYWQHRLDQELHVRRVWEDNMAKIAMEHEELETRIGESEEKRRRTKRALRDALENQLPSTSETEENAVATTEEQTTTTLQLPSRKARASVSGRRKSTFAELADIAASASEEEDDEEFFDAIGTGEVEVVEELPSYTVVHSTATNIPIDIKSDEKIQPVSEPSRKDLQSSFKGYEDPVRVKLKLDADNRPKISLWSILKSMIGKDMTKMTLPVTFNEPTSLLQRVAEDMEYTDLLDTAATRADSTERMVYVAAFAISEYASTIGRVAKPFNPLLGETYEYARPDKGFRFIVEQVSHHPPVGAAWAEAANWDYYGESAVKSKFYGKSFDINPLGTWFLKLRPTALHAVEEMYTWKKVTSSVVGIITGNPTVDNYGPMEIKNHTTGEVCLLEFKQRGWKASSAFQVTGKIVGADNKTRWSIGGRWNDKIYARLTPGYEDAMEDGGGKSKDANPNKAFLVWEAHKRPTNIPFNLTPFVVTLNALPARLKPVLPPTDTRLRPDQRAMEDGEYDLAATEKNRVEEKQRAARRDREVKGEEYKPSWFKKGRCEITGEEYWVAIGSSADEGGRSGGVEYWNRRGKGDWQGAIDIF